MAASGKNANWDAAALGSTDLPEIQSCTIATNGRLTSFSSGVDRYPTEQILLMSEPSIQITMSDVGAAMGLAPGTKDDFEITLKDAMGAAGGDIVFAGENATVETNTATGSHAQLATATLSLKLASSDGATNPLSFTRA